MNIETRIYTLEGAAELISCNKEILRQKICSKEIKAYKKLGRWYLFYPDIVDFIKSEE